MTGTGRHGRTDELDRRTPVQPPELPKELAEHVMLFDPAPPVAAVLSAGRITAARRLAPSLRA